MSYHALPLADDIAPIVMAFREAGGLSLDLLADHKEARVLYQTNCQAAAFPLDDTVLVREWSIGLNGKSIHLRQYTPAKAAGQALRTCTLFMHGGGWVIGNLDTHDNLCRYFCLQSDSDVIAVDYGLAPEQDFDEILRDCHQSLTYIQQNASQFSINPTRIALMGDSAGGYLANYIAHQFTQTTQQSLLAQILLYPVVNLEPAHPSYDEFEAGFMLNSNTMRWFLKHCNLDQLEQPIDSYQLTSLPYSSSNGAVFLSTVGYDPLRDEGLALAQHLARSGAYLEHVHLPQHVHGIFTMLGKVPTARLVIDQAAAFLKRLS